MQMFTQIGMSLALGIAGLIVLVLGARWLNSNTMSKRLNQYVAIPLETTHSRTNTARTQSRVITGSFVNRTITPAIKVVGSFFGRITPGGAIEGLSHKLLIAGNPLGLGPREFYGISLASTLLGVYLAFIFFRRGTEAINIALSILVLIFFYSFPKVWLNNRIKHRQNSVKKGLPDAMDMLSVCATAGLGFDRSLQRVSEYWETPIGL